MNKLGWLEQKLLGLLGADGINLLVDGFAILIKLAIENIQLKTGLGIVNQNTAILLDPLMEHRDSVLIAYSESVSAQCSVIRWDFPSLVSAVLNVTEVRADCPEYWPVFGWGDKLWCHSKRI